MTATVLFILLAAIFAAPFMYRPVAALLAVMFMCAAVFCMFIGPPTERPATLLPSVVSL